MAKALISIDYTNDFVADDGLLTAGQPAQAIEKVISKVTLDAFEAGDYIFFAIDGHDKGDQFHPETKLFPAHNIMGTSGRHLYGALGELYQDIKDNASVFWIDKRYYSAFSGTDLDSRLRERRVDTLVLTGVLTDICVLHTAIDAYHLGYKIQVVEKAVASLSDSNHNWALQHMSSVLAAEII
ncbi:isochorismatase [Streptococcus iniae]|uniref:cysteine hydrolase family protein n=1 Tax=Streptococcus iniae TaxID=1346 RepID=UPI000EF71010|nr:isochorismatase family cysteine hydrolase [Streptococcus iniae]RLV27170.1 isochorismatase [Streptococcus iniae]